MFHHLARLSARHPLLVLLAGLVLTLGLGRLAADLRVETSFDALLPEDTPEVQDVHKVNEEVGGIGYVVAVVDGADSDGVLAWAERFAAAVREVEGVRYVEHRFDVEFFEERALLLLTPDRIRELTAAIERKIDAGKVRANPLFVDLLDDEEEAPEPTLAELEARYRADVPVQDRLMAADGRSAIVLIKPTGLAGDVKFSEGLVDRLSWTASRLGAIVGFDGTADQSPEGVRVRFTGNYVVRAAENRIMLGDLKMAAGLALLLSVSLVAAWTRRPRAVLLVGLPLIAGIVWTAGFTRLFTADVNIITGFLAAVLTGLGIDFGIHLFMRFMEERRDGFPVEAALERAMAVTGRAALTGATTTAAAFFVLSMAEFEGFSQFGKVAGAGVLISLTATYVMGPPLYVLAERVLPLVTSKSRVPRPIRLRRPVLVTGLIVASIGAFMAFSVVSLGDIEFVTDFRKLQGEMPEVSLQAEVTADLGTTTSPALAMTRDREGALRVQEAIADIRRTDGHTLGSILSLTDLVPLDQPERLEALAELRRVLSDPAIDRLPADERERARRALARTHARPFTVDEAPDFVHERFLSPGGEYVLSLLSASKPLYDTRNLLDWADALAGIRDRVREAGSDIWIADENRIAARIFRLVLDDGPVVLIGALLAVLLLLVIDLRHVGRAVLVLSPLVVGTLGIAGLMRLTGIHLNFLNAVMVPAIVGIGIDNAVHVYHRYRKEGAGSLGRVIRNTGSAAFLATATTAIGFGTLVLSHHGGLHSVGWLALLGMLSTFMATTIFFPALLWLLERAGGGRAP